MSNLITSCINFLSQVRITDICDIAIITLCFYAIKDLLHEARIWQIMKGIIIFIVATWVSDIFQLNAVNFILRSTMQVGILALIILFQPELRRMLERIGRANFQFLFHEEEVDYVLTASEIAKAACSLSRAKLGALIVIEGKSPLEEYFVTGTELNAKITADLLITIFFNKTPLHDGAVIICGNKIRYAACVLPMTSNHNLERELGTRHRAAIGLSERSDATIVVVSEETGKISIARDGFLKRDYTEPTLLEDLEKTLKGNKPSVAVPKKLHSWRWSFSAKK